MAGDHPRIVQGMHAAARCGAKTRQGAACAAPAVAGKKRCRMHGGAKGSGAPKGNKNALKSGLYTAEAIEMRRHVMRLVRATRKTILEI
jgi:uncharacterized protein YjcR